MASALEKKAYIGLLFNETDLAAMTRVRHASIPMAASIRQSCSRRPASCGEVRLAAGEDSGGVMDLE